MTRSMQVAPLCFAATHRRCVRGTLLALTINLLTACSLGPEYIRPQVPSPANWHENVPQAAQWPSTDWWQGFGSTQLNDYIAQARKTNNDLAAAIARVRQADANAAIAGAPLLPSVGANMTAVKEREQATSYQYVDFKQYAPQLTVSYIVDFWGKNRAAQSAALATAQASRRDQATIEITVVTSVALTWFQSMELHDRLKIARENLASGEHILAGLHQQLKAGVATALDVAQQETTVANLNAAIPPLEQQLRQSLDALAVLIGQTPESLDESSASLIDLGYPQVAPGLPSDLLARRPDVAEAEDQLVSANANIAVARASFFPTIQLSVGGGYASSQLSTLVRSASSVYTFAAGISQPIFDGGVLKGQYALAQARYDELVADYRKTVLTAFANVEDALVSVQKTGEQLQRLTIATDKALRAYTIAQAQLHAGTVNILTVLNTETALFTAQDAVVQAKYAHLQALVNLYGALGGGWQKETKA